ncbi:hypothetical protein [Caldimonas sp. KR1-144]|uniref:hypothetical protein n=1 Tax=Caldimonas sp. KR1-144 TaxID=3400911 RepID=UPI003BFC17CF
MTAFSFPDLTERLFQRLLDALGVPAEPQAPPPLEAKAWGRAYAQELQRAGSPLPDEWVLQRGMDLWVTEYPRPPERVARAELERDDDLHADTVPAAFLNLGSGARSRL